MNSLLLLTLLFAVVAVVAGIPLADGTADRNKIVIHCEENEQWYECGRCEGTCDNLDPVCPMMCRPSCSCIEGHVRHGKERRCIPIHDCPKVQPVEVRPPEPDRVHPPVCSDNEVLFPCGACDGSCSEPEPKCPRACLPASCGCMKDHVREPQGHSCIHKSQCPKEPADLRIPPADIRIPPADIREPPADLRIPPADIRPPPFGGIRPPWRRCPEKEMWFPCGACDGSCVEIEPICSKICQPASCGCIANHVRESKGHSCIHKTECPREPLLVKPLPADIPKPPADLHVAPADIKMPPADLHPPRPRCPDKEMWFPCGACDGSCLEFEPVCPKMCVPGGSCGCIQDHVREPKGHSCIHKRDCPLLMPILPPGGN